MYTVARLFNLFFINSHSSHLALKAANRVSVINIFNAILFFINILYLLWIYVFKILLKLKKKDNAIKNKKRFFFERICDLMFSEIINLFIIKFLLNK